MPDRIVLGFSGGLHTSIAIPWLTERYGAEVIAVTLDVGQGRELTQIRERAIAAGAARCHVLDVRDEFARDYVLPALKAGALHGGQYPLASALTRPLIGRKLVEIARMENASAIAHGASGAVDADQGIDISARAVDPAIEVIAPTRLWGMTGAEAIEYATARRIAAPIPASGGYRTERNLCDRSIQGGLLDDLSIEPPEEVYTLTKSPAQAPDLPAHVDIDWVEGVPVAVSGVAMPLAELINSLETIAGGHGVGRIDAVVDQRGGGAPARVVHEAPAAVVLHTAHRDIEGLVTPADLQALKAYLSQTYAHAVYNGEWVSRTREAIDAFVQVTQQRVTGTVRVKLYKGSCQVVGRKLALASDAADRHADSPARASHSTAGT